MISRNHNALHISLSSSIAAWAAAHNQMRATAPCQQTNTCWWARESKQGDWASISFSHFWLQFTIHSSHSHNFSQIKHFFKTSTIHPSHPCYSPITSSLRSNAKNSTIHPSYPHQFCQTKHMQISTIHLIFLHQIRQTKECKKPLIDLHEGLHIWSIVAWMQERLVVVGQPAGIKLQNVELV
jgi:hypothetical protein